MKNDIGTHGTAAAAIESTEGKVTNAEDVDAALTFLRSNAASYQSIDIDEKKLMRKVD